jgi:hypothetical protein
MQRAAASSPASPATSTPGATTPVTEPPSKRRRFETSSPAFSGPGTPRNDGTPIPSRGGISTFNPFEVEGVDTEWTLDEQTSAFSTSQRSEQAGANGRRITDGANGFALASRFGALADQPDAGENESSEEDDIWAAKNTTGRQTFGAFKKRSLRPKEPQEASNDADLSSASDPEVSGSDEDDDDDSDSSGSESDSSPARQRQRIDVDSDEEMRQVRAAIEQKHRNMAGLGQRTSRPGGGAGRNSGSGRDRFASAGGARGGSSSARGGRGGGVQKRKGREQGSYKMKKKAKAKKGQKGK